MTALRHPPHTAYVDDGECLLVANLDEPQLVSLTNSARLIWQAADEREPEEVVHRVAEQVGVAAEQIRADVIGFIELLLGTGLLERTDRSPAARHVSDAL